MRPKPRPRHQESQTLSTFSFFYLLYFRLLASVPLEKDGTKNFCSSRPSGIGGLRSEELFDEDSRVVRVLFGKKVATLHCLPSRARSPLAPNTQRATVFRIESVERAVLGP